MGVFIQSWCFWDNLGNYSECFYHNAIENVFMKGEITISLYFILCCFLPFSMFSYQEKCQQNTIFIFVTMFVQQYAKTITAGPKFSPW